MELKLYHGKEFYHSKLECKIKALICNDWEIQSVWSTRKEKSQYQRKFAQRR